MDEMEMNEKDPMGLSKEDLEALFEGAFKSSIENHSNKGPKTPLFDGSFEASKSDPSDFEASRSQKKNFKTGGGDSRVKSSLRMKYEAEVQAVKKQNGDLEAIRRQLGLSKRKMAQLLLVDPSAWTRWTSEEGEAPPHIYRALHWYLLLQEKHPEYRSSLWLNAVATPQLSDHEIENIKAEVLKRARNESRNLSKTIRWLLLGQGFLVLILLLTLIF